MEPKKKQDLELISFKLCPYVQRSVITLNYKSVPYQISYIDLANPPDWFNKISPMGKVPALKVGPKEGKDGTVLFESAVINEYLDEVNPPSLHPKDPLRKAYERAWIEFGSELLVTHYQLSFETDSAAFEKLKTDFFEDLGRLEDQVSAQGPYFRGKEFSLVDCAYAPLFMRIFLSEKLTQDPAWKKIPRVNAWGKVLMEVPAVKNSVVKEFPELYRAFVEQEGSLVY